jgi:radical SAM superfamily enzyme YgiQ (UPF0313 family)
MKVVLVQPPIRDFYDTDIRLQPLGLCMLKAAVKKHMPEVDVVVKDYHQGWGRKTIAYPSEFSYLREYYRYHDRSPFSMFHHFYHFGAGFDELAEDVAKEKPDIVGLSSLFSPYYREALACARAIKGVIDVPIIMGGSHVSAVPHSMLLDPSVDYIIRGEGERPLVEFLRTFMSHGSINGVPNLGFKHNSEIILNPAGNPYDLNELAWADFSDLPLDRYCLNKQPLCFITTSRGCPHKCAFCSVHQTFGDGFRSRSLEDVVMEIQKRYDDGYRVFDFEDDNLSFTRDYFKELLNRLISLFPGRDIKLVAMNGISYMSLDSEILELMKRAGFSSLNISVVSSKAETLKRYRRPHKLDKFFEIVDKARSLGLDIVTYQILGLPGESLDDMTETMALLAGLPVLIGVSIFYLTPGSPAALEFPDMTGDDIVKSRSTAMAVETREFMRDDLFTLFITARIINFLKGIKSGAGSIGFMNALKIAEGSDKRSALGADILIRLFKEKKFYAATGNEMKVINRFKTELFFRLWERLQNIYGQDGGRIDLHKNYPLDNG